MRPLYAYPYLRPAAARIAGAAWQFAAESDGVPVEDRIAHWDPAVSLSLTREISLDYEGILRDTQLGPDARLRLVATWLSAGTMLRGNGGAAEVSHIRPGESVRLDVFVPGDQLSLNIRIETMLVVARPGSTTSSFAARRPGSVLWRDDKVILLEGQATRFPTEVIDFGAGMRLPENAMWFLDWDLDDLHKTALGSMCLYLNSRHPAVQQAVVGVSQPGQTSGPIWQTILFEVHRTMISGALQNEDFVRSPEDYADGSVGEYIRRRCTTLFGESSVPELSYQLRDQAGEFECLLQDRLKLFDGT